MNNGGNISDVKAQRIAYLIAGFINQTLTEEEHEELDAWVQESDENMLLFEDLTDEDNIEAGLTAMRQGNASLAYQKIRKKIPFKKQAVSKAVWVYGLAASVIIIVALSYFLFPFKKSTNIPPTVVHNEKDINPGTNKAVLTLADGRVIILQNQENGNLALANGVKVSKLDSGAIAYAVTTSNTPAVINTLSTPRGGQYTVTLSDGTKVWLNAATSLKYPMAFDSKERRVELDGEAYFEVAHDTGRPFHVVSISQEITVLGTKFNVNAYRDENVVTTTLLEGKVQLATIKEKKIILPGEQFITAATGAISKNTSADIDGTMAWKKGIFHFRNAPIEDILKQVSRWYDAEITYETKIDQHFNADISRQLPVSKLLNLLEKTGSVRFEIEGRNIKVKK